MGNEQSTPGGGGAGAPRQQSPPSRAQVLIDTTEVQWRSASEGQAPSQRETAGCLAPDGSLVVIGGHGVEDEHSDVWSLRTGGGAWQAHTPAGRAPRPRGGHTVAWTPVGPVVFGGISHEKGGYLADVAHLAADGSEWLPVSVSGELPCARDKHAAVVLASGGPSGRMLVLGGFGVKPPDEDEDECEGEEVDAGEEGADQQRRGPSVEMTWFNDVYSLELSTWRWSKLHPSAVAAATAAAAPAGSSAAAAVSSTAPVPPAAEAETVDATPPSAASAEPAAEPAAVFKFPAVAAPPAVAPAKDGTAPDDGVLLPPPRAAHAACLVPSVGGSEGGGIGVTAEERIVLFGGRTATGRVDDTWVLDGLTSSEGVWRVPQIAGARPAARSFHACTAVPSASASLVAIFGGLGVDDRHLADLHLLHVAGESEWMWAAVRQAGALPSPRGCMVLACLGGGVPAGAPPELLVFGGSSSW